MLRERQTAMMATLVSECVWKRLYSFLILDTVVCAMTARNGRFEAVFISCGFSMIGYLVGQLHNVFDSFWLVLFVERSLIRAVRDNCRQTSSIFATRT